MTTSPPSPEQLDAAQAERLKKFLDQLRSPADIEAEAADEALATSIDLWDHLQQMKQRLRLAAAIAARRAA